MGLLTVVSYSELPALQSVYLEDSFVLAIEESPDELVFELDAVLMATHPSYAPPRPGEQYCFRRARLVFKPDNVSWLARSQTRFRDASGEEDLGNIDVFTTDHHRYHLEGDWGTVDVTSSVPPEFLVTEM
ncbi:MAG TPA: hypothetical protein VFB06_09120 [Streptosporangiaceae bacterium]|nr:hypothetical protein [Streptosporangiaceae bacterium]